ncbi:protein maelstrom homolog [Hylaeus anthracinus]|uniref:protein maelstrom homolog n=1 Tax=Hylaeus anthracinus TaxID=313031 RepID=UPI0023B91894|nr:protein maelstrom homolog [Hylaeus anthracinus]
MPKNNTKGKNAFHFFMLDWKRKQEKCGKVFKNGLKDVATDPQCSEDWKNLAPHLKGEYKAKAKESKVLPQRISSKQTTIGENIEEILLEQKREEQFQQNMIQYINAIIAIGTQHKNLEKLKFIFIHVNKFYRREIGINKFDFCPAEFAIGEFSLEDGMANIYHEIISSKIPLGWKRDALETSSETHKIPINMSGGQNDFAYMYERVVNILKSNMTGIKFPPLFTVRDVVPVVKSLLSRMTEATNTSMDDFVVYTLETLFGELRNAATQHVDDISIPLVVAENEFKKDVFASTRGLECDYHKNIEDSSQYCSMSIIKRWCFTICDYCCEYMNIPMIQGVHYPVSEKCSNSTILESLGNLTINDSVNVVSMTGVTEEHRLKVSGRTYTEEQRRRNLSQPVNIIDHSKTYSLNNSIIPGRPLRPPKTTAQAIIKVDDTSIENNYTINILKDMDFPALGGRGISLAKNKMPIKVPLGKGRGKC